MADSLYMSLHTKDPDWVLFQNEYELDLPGYERVPIPDVSLHDLKNVTFPICKGGRAVATHYAIGRLKRGSNRILHTGALYPPLVVSNRVIAVITQFADPGE